MATPTVSSDRLNPVPETMTACRVHRFGGPEAIAVETVPVPQPGEGEVLVRVAAAGVGPWDAWVRSGRSVLPQPLPLTLGADCSGQIAAIGKDVEDLRVGEMVFGVTNRRFVGAYAGYALAVATMVARKPAKLSAVEAAGAPVVSVTAWQALFEQAKLKRGDLVVIHGAAGGVGAFAVQLARWAGLKIVATCAARDIEYVTSLGANEALDYRHANLGEGRRADAVIDLVGGDAQSRAFGELRPEGALISTVSLPDAVLAGHYDVRASFFVVEVTTARLSKIADLIAQDVLHVDVGTVLPLTDARLAHEMLDGARPRPLGKIVLENS